MTAIATPAIWNDVERAAWSLPESLTVSEWCDHNRVLDSNTSAEPGLWRTARTPYLREILDAFTDPGVEEIVLMMSTQVGKTEAMLNMMAYAIDQDPGPMLYVGAREPDAKNLCEFRIHPMVRLSESLSQHLTGRQDDVSRERIIFDRMGLFVAGAGSPAALASKPMRYLFLDEMNKYPKFSGDESDPGKLARERTKTFWNRKIVKASTPTTRTGNISREYESSDQRRLFLPCPHCGAYQYLVWGQVQFPHDERQPARIRNERLAWYQCVECSCRIEDNHKHAMLARGVWAPEGCSVNKDGSIVGAMPATRKRGYWMNALYSPWSTFSDAAAEFLESKDKPELLMNFWNSWMAEIWEEKAHDVSDTRIMSLRSDFKPTIIPPRAVVLTAGVDVQLDHFWYVIRAWGAFEESWLVQNRRVETWDELEADIIKTEYQSEDGFRARVRLACVDSGYNAGEVYDFCKLHKEKARPTKGVDSIGGGAPYTVSKIEKHPKTHQIIPGGLTLFKLDTTYFKDKLARLIMAERDDRSKWFVHSEITEQYARQVTSEHKLIVRNKKTGRTKQAWTLKSASAANHYLDCEVYALAAAEMLRVNSLKEEDIDRLRRLGNPTVEAKPKPQRPPGQNPNWSIGDTSSWMDR